MSPLESIKGNVKIFDNKRFRVKGQNVEFHYQGNFNKEMARKIAKLQIGFAIFIIIGQTITMSITQHSSLESMGCGVWASLLTILAGLFTLAAVNKPSYCKIHFTMAFQIISFLAFLFFSIFALGDSLPTYRYHIRTYFEDKREKEMNVINSASVVNNYNNNYNSNSNEYYENNDDSQNETIYAPQYPHNIYNNPGDYFPSQINYYQPYSQPIELTLMSLSLTLFMTVFGLGQLVLSGIVSAMSAKSLCPRHILVEGNAFGIEGVCIENAKINYDLKTQNSPPPYNNYEIPSLKNKAEKE